MIFNEFGALDHSLPVNEDLEKACDNFERELKELIRKHSVSPVDMRGMCAYCVNSVTATFAEETLRKGIDMRRKQRMIKP